MREIAARHVGLLFKQNPAIYMRNLAELLTNYWKGEAGIFVLQPTGFELIGGKLRKETVGLVRTEHRRNRKELEAGLVHESRGLQIHPVPDDRGTVIALLCLRDCWPPPSYLDDCLRMISATFKVAPLGAAKEQGSEVERRSLMLLLERCEWNIAQAARRLGWSRTTLYTAMKQLEIQRKKVRKSKR